MVGWNKGLTATTDNRVRRAAELNRGKTRPVEAVARTAAANRGQKRSIESVEKMRKPKSLAHRAALSTAMKGKKRGPRPQWWRNKISARLLGKSMTEQHKQAVRNGRLRHLDNHDDTCHCVYPGRSGPSGLSWKLIDFLTNAGFEIVIPEQRFGTYFVDAYLANEHIAFEADGDYWHNLRSANYDTTRDAYLLTQFKLPVVRLREKEIEALSYG